MEKKRFGVSIPSEIAEEVNKLAMAQSKDRSAIIADAIEEYLHRAQHLIKVEHICKGAVLVYERSAKSRSLLRIPSMLERYGEVVIGYSLLRTGEGALFVALVKGESDVLAQIIDELSKSFESVKYIPIGCKR